MFDAEASDDLTMAGLEIERLADASATDIHWARDLYGALEARGQDPVERPFAALNTAFATDGVRDPGDGRRREKPVSLIYLHREHDGLTRSCITSSGSKKVRN